MITIRLPKSEWRYDPKCPLGPPGGFGEVFAGESDELPSVAIKKLHVDAHEAAHREMRIAEDLSGRDFMHVISVYDAGLDAESDSYFVVMARAEKSLQEFLDNEGVPSQEEATRILLDIAKGLREVADLVHRDLKPGNVLFHEGTWKIADFGIARFVEESTSLNTLKRYLTPDYAAPEQWKSERATNVTDVYALGCIGNYLLSGSTPFTGSTEDLREAHLNDPPKDLPPGITPQLSSLISLMLRKFPNSRPNAERVIGILEDCLQGFSQPSPSGGAYDQLARAGDHVAKAEASDESLALAELLKEKTRSEVAKAAHGILGDLVEGLFAQIETIAPVAIRQGPSTISLGKGIISFDRLFSEKVLPLGAFERSGWDVLTGVTIKAGQQSPRYAPSSSLLYMDPNGKENYRWYEVSYFDSSFTRSRSSNTPDEPFALSNIEDADFAAAPLVHAYSLAFGPRLIDDEDAIDFYERWASILARAAVGNLGRPGRLPLSENL